MDASGSNGGITFSLFGDSPSAPLHATSASAVQPGGFSSSDLTSLLTAEILRSLADVYFSRCHRQLYSYFHEESFRKHLEDTTLPSYLLFTFVATAVRFSDEPCFASRQAEFTDAYARLAWSELMKEAFSEMHSMNLQMVQAASMLGIIDYISMSIRGRTSWLHANRFQVVEID